MVHPRFAGFLLPAIVLPTLIAFTETPTVTFFNQVAAVGGWGLALAVLGLAVRPVNARVAHVGRPLIGALMLLAAAVVWSALQLGLPRGLALQALALIGAAIFVFVLGLARPDAVEAYATALVVAAVVSTAMALVQIFAPELADGVWLASPHVAGRAVGNLRQPNHLSSLLLMGAAALVWLGGRRAPDGRWALAWVAAPMLLLLWGVVASGSRTGMVGTAMLALWGLADRSLPRRLRLLLMLLPLIYAAWWFAMLGWAHGTDHAFIGEKRLQSGGDISSSRFAIWSNTLALIRAYPWTGVGWGEFNQAWTLTPFPDRPVAFFDHSHNLVLQLIVELGLPLGLLVLGLLAWSLLALVRRAWQPEAMAARLALYVVLLMLVHSMLEYPLWYAYFLLPTAFAWGFGLTDPPTETTSTRPAWATVLAGVLLLVAALAAIPDYRRVVAIYDPPEGDTRSLKTRVQAGQGSFIFGYQADYAAATTEGLLDDQAAYAALMRTRHNLLDARLMVTWSKAEAARGQPERAAHLSARVAEFRHKLGQAYRADCAQESPGTLTLDAPPHCRADPALSLEALSQPSPPLPD